MASETTNASVIGKGFNREGMNVASAAESHGKDARTLFGPIVKNSEQIAQVVDPVRTIASKIDQHTFSAESVIQSHPDSSSNENTNVIKATLENVNASDFREATKDSLLGSNSSDKPSQ